MFICRRNRESPLSRLNPENRYYHTITPMFRVDEKHLSLTRLLRAAGVLVASGKTFSTNFRGDETEIFTVEFVTIFIE